MQGQTFLGHKNSNLRLSVQFQATEDVTERLPKHISELPDIFYCLESQNLRACEKIEILRQLGPN